MKEKTFQLKIASRTTVWNDKIPDAGRVNFNSETANNLLCLRRFFDATYCSDSTLFQIEFLQSHVEWLLLDEEEYVTSKEATELNAVSLQRTGICFRAVMKHTEDGFETEEIPWSELEDLCDLTQDTGEGNCPDPLCDGDVQIIDNSDYEDGLRSYPMMCDKCNATWEEDFLEIYLGKTSVELPEKAEVSDD